MAIVPVGANGVWSVGATPPQPTTMRANEQATSQRRECVFMSSPRGTMHDASRVSVAWLAVESKEPAWPEIMQRI